MLLAAASVLALSQVACLGAPSPLAPGLRGSIGVPHHGVLTDGVELPPRGPGFVRYRPRGAHYWGTPELVETLQRTAAAMEAARPGAPPLTVGDLSGRHGGKIPRHQSHRTGRDADLLFYTTTPAGAPIPSPGFVHFERDGLAVVGGTYVRFDVERNWLLVKYLVGTQTRPVQWLFVHRDLESLLVDYALARGEDPELVWHAENMMLQPGDSANHDDHFHLRLACTPTNAATGCEGGGPYWEWLPDLPALGQLSPADLMAIGQDDPLRPSEDAATLLPPAGSPASEGGV